MFCFVFLQTQGPPFFAFNQSADSFESYSQKNKGGVPAIRATEYKKNKGPEKIVAHTHLWRESTQIEHSNQRMAQQV